MPFAPPHGAHVPKIFRTPHEVGHKLFEDCPEPPPLTDLTPCVTYK